MYSKENRLIIIESEKELKKKTQLVISEQMIQNLKSESVFTIFDNQAKIQNEHRFINKMKTIKEFRAVPLTSPYMLSTQGKNDRRQISENLKKAGQKAKERLEKIKHQ